MLMDEPLASLDEARKAEIMPYIERLRDEAGIPIVYVSHAIGEVTRLATDVVVLAAGERGRQRGLRRTCWRASILAARRRSRRDRRSVSISTLVGAGRGVRPEPRCAPPAATGGCRAWKRPSARGVRARIRARDVMLALERPRSISALNVLPATVSAIAAGEGADAMVRLDCGGDTLYAR